MAHLITLRAKDEETYRKLSQQMHDAQKKMSSTNQFLVEIKEDGLILEFIVRYKKPVPDKIVKKLVYEKMKKKMKKEFKDNVSSTHEIIEHDFIESPKRSEDSDFKEVV